jgi:hypothetical protein
MSKPAENHPFRERAKFALNKQRGKPGKFAITKTDRRISTCIDCGTPCVTYRCADCENALDTF